MSKHKKTTNFRNIILTHVLNNIKEYVITLIIFIIGIIIGVMFINNTNLTQQTEITEYINKFITQLKENSNINRFELLRNSIIENIGLGVILWFVGSTVIGIPIVFGLICFRGICLGYTISSIIAILGNLKGMFFVIISMLFQNILFIPSVLALGVSGIKVAKSIIKNKTKENIKQEIYRHTVFSFIIILVLIISAFIEVYISTNLLTVLIKFF